MLRRRDANIKVLTFFVRIHIFINSNCDNLRVCQSTIWLRVFNENKIQLLSNVFWFPFSIPESDKFKKKIWRKCQMDRNIDGKHKETHEYGKPYWWYCTRIVLSCWNILIIWYNLVFFWSFESVFILCSIYVSFIIETFF